MNIRRGLLLAPVALLILLAVVYFAAESWLESAGGKRALEESLSARIGMPVRLGGEFNVRLLPSIGVAATQLAVSDPVSGEEVATGKYVEVDLALAPLLREELNVHQLVVEGLKVKLPDGSGLFVPRITLGSFGFNRPTVFDVDWSWMGQLNGQFTWLNEQSRVILDVVWGAENREDIGYRGKVDYGPGLLRFTDSRISLGSQSAGAEGCLLLSDPPELNLQLATERLDLEPLLAVIPGGEGTAESLPFQLNLRLDAAEIRRGDAVAYDTKLELGRQPSCP